MIQSGVNEKILNQLKYKDCVVSFCHDDYRKITSGSQKYVIDLQQMMNDRNISCVALITASNFDADKIEPKNLIIEVVIDNETVCFLTAWQVGYYFGSLITANKINLLSIIINSLFRMNIAMIDEIISRINEKHNVEVLHIFHDYYSICRNIFLFYNDEEFCGPAPIGSPRCKTCRHGENREEHYESINKLFIKHNVTIVAPSENGKRIFLRIFQHLEQSVRVVPHQNVIPLKSLTPSSYSISNKRIRVAFLGYPLKNKGWDAWIKINEIPNRSDYDFYHFTCIDQSLPGTIFVDTSFHNGSNQDTTSRLLEHEIDVVLLWSNWFGNYNYTYYESLEANCFVVTYKDSGNIADQIKHFGNGLVLDSEQELVALFNNNKKLKECVANYKKSNEVYRVVVNNQLADELLDKRLFLRTEIQSFEEQLNNDYEQAIDSLIQGKLELQRELQHLQGERKGLQQEMQDQQRELQEFRQKLLEYVENYYRLELHSKEVEKQRSENSEYTQQLKSHYEELEAYNQLVVKRLNQLENEGSLKTFLRAFYKLFPQSMRIIIKKLLNRLKG
ncbi:hypothetical protein PAECIP111891_03212 [Paenibacillus allorhizoplanae]|uniref:Glycosyltransferase n=1 Tax=Paenibacillus allorhizoplanae TaxID=2905648 RepID=A0ABM9CA08_9BACL|nr:hypothetical protein [Paenibacillus allorhizoplanae]CAH1208395.1 hypothetical protein PAECIP111891_03212 [Paenibacillus allorhizoplanae]